VARADEAAAIEAITKLNKRALDEYENLNFDQAKKTLNEALDLCAKNGLGDHPITARTHIHLGVVTLGGSTTGREEAIRQFQKALAIEPEIKLTSQVANPEVQAAFDEAVKSAPPPAKQPDSSGGSSAPPNTTPAPATEGLSHDVVASGVKGKPIAISVTTDPALAAAKVVLVFRPEGASDFMQVELKEYSPGNWSGSIPETATAGTWVAYALSVANEAGEVVGTQGSPEAPMVVRLSAAPARAQPERHPDEEPEPEPEPTEANTWFFGLGLGTGVGWASGNGDLHVTDKVASGFGASKLGHLMPEVGYFLSPDLLLSVQLRLQFVSGATAMRDPTATMCGSDHICDPATAAQAVLARATWLFGDGAVRPYLSGVLGAGQIRHMATIPGANMCGSNPASPVKCVDTVTAGPIFAGGAVGVILNASSNFGVTLGVTPLLGFPNFTFHLDFNGGVVIQL
jgi:hypothetical protein